MLKNLVAASVACLLAVGVSGGILKPDHQWWQSIGDKSKAEEAPDNSSRNIESPASAPVSVAPAAPASTTQTPAFSTKSTKQQQPKRLKLTLSLSQPQDLKVKEGQEVKAKQVLSDRTVERQRLTQQRQQLEIALKRLSIPTPGLTPIAPPPPVAQLPEPSYDVQFANIQLAENAIAAKQADIRLQQEKINYLSALPPAAENSHVPLAKDAVAQKQLEINLQQQKISELNQIPDLPKVTLQHEAAVLGQLQQELNTAKLKLKSALAFTNSATAKNQEAIKEEKAVLAKKQGELKTAIVALNVERSRLKEAQSNYQQKKYENQLEQERRLVASQQQRLDYERQISTRAAQEKEREYQKASVQAQIQNVDNQLANIAQVRAPYDGKVRRIKWLKGSDNTLAVELTLAKSRSRTTVQEQQPGVSQPTNSNGFIQRPGDKSP